MTKLLEAYRHKIDSFEVVDIADPQEIQRLQLHPSPAYLACWCLRSLSQWMLVSRRP